MKAVLKQAAVVISLLFSGISLHETVLKQPWLTIYAGCMWQYGRGPGATDEYLVIPVTVANDGARGGTVLAIELVVEKSGQAKTFVGNYTVAGLDDSTRQLFAPFAIAGRTAATASVVFTQRTPTGASLVGELGRYHARLKLRTTVSSGFIDRLLASPPAEAHVEPWLQEFDLSKVLGGQRAGFNACGANDTDLLAAPAK